MDLLFRSSQTTSPASTTDARAEAARILANGVATGDVPTTDRAYLAELVASRTGISAEEAQKRVDNAIAQAKAADVKARELADKARKAAAETSIFTALSMLVGAFIACIAAALGGQRRDLHAKEHAPRRAGDDQANRRAGAPRQLRRGVSGGNACD